jgi:hypothetical protein
MEPHQAKWKKGLDMNKANLRVLVRNMVIELLIYGVLLVIYFYVVLRFLGGFLTNLFHEQLIVYGVVGLGLIVIQAVILEAVTSFLLGLLRLDRTV